MSPFIIFGLLMLFSGLEGLMLELQPNSRRCLKEEVHKDVLVTGEYEINEIQGQTIDIQVTDTKGHVLVNHEDKNKGKFAFTTDEYDVFELCFISKVQQGYHGQAHEVSIFIKTGVEAKNYEGLGDASQLKPLEIELKRLEDLSESIVQAFAYMRQREEDMRNTNESTNSRVFYLSVFSMLCLVGLATWQVIYLRQYFKSKKLIE
ncbi:transmembrane emp24 domain-containing protein bai-like [Artemia franciscana]|uniref:GOLD domain-containing protein n=1 Tax=Artemia franciscana TaxID=6661 RepID=A0AA88HXU0_ARTSF|nr:hypothetical protein QYM36_008679 [Artemia franciscana]